MQQPGRITWDTKLDLVTDPAAFLARSLHLWNPNASFGELQNQAYGYLFPQGPFFLLGAWAGLPEWVTQRLWSALLLVVAYEGTRRCAAALSFGALPSAVAGLGYALAPRLLGAVGVLTGEVLPSAVLPFALLPLVWARTGRLAPRQAALWSGVGVLCMSGVNAAGTLATFPLLGAVVLGGIGIAQGLRLAAWWVVAVSLATAWWVAPLLLLGRFSPPFLDYIETSGATTFSATWSNNLRGAEHWLAYYTIGGQPWWPGAHAIATSGLLVVAGSIVTAVGFYGLVRSAMPLRWPLLMSVAVGLLFLVAGNPATAGSLVDGDVRELLDGPLAPFRNVHKVDPLIRLPLALGLAYVLTSLPDLVRTHRYHRSTVRGTTLALMALVVASGLPLATSEGRMPGYERIPAAWKETATYLAEQPASRALVVPGSGFGLQTWGWTIDEPLQGLSRAAWVTRSQVPLVPGPTARYLETVERRLASGEGSAQLRALLARGSVTHVVLRRDLDRFVTETTAFERVESALTASSGLDRVASFGRSGFGDQSLIDVYRVRHPLPVASVVDAADLSHLYGAPDDLLPAMESGVLHQERLVVMGASEDRGPRIVGDSYQKVERQFGRVHDAASAVMTSHGRGQLQRPSRDFAAPPGIDEAVARLDGVLDVEASSSQGYADEFGPVLPQFGPTSALDSNRSTAWRSGSLQPADEQWLDVTLDRSLPAGEPVVVHFEQGREFAELRRVRVTFGVGADRWSTVHAAPPEGPLVVTVPDTQARKVRVEVVEASDLNSVYGQVGISELKLPGITPRRSIQLPTTLKPGDDLVLRTDPPRRACVDLGLGPQCNADAARPAPEGERLDRTFTVGATGSWAVTGSVVARPGQASAALMLPLGDRVASTASSVLGGDPAVSGVFATDANPRTAWLAEPTADRATLTLTWKGPRIVSGLEVQRGPAPSVAPVSAVVKGGGKRRVVSFGYLRTFEPFVARGRLKIVFNRSRELGSYGRPLGVSEVSVAGLEGLAAVPSLQSPTGATCGLGPEVRIDGAPHRTEVSGTIDDVRLGRPLDWRVCDGPVSLSPGEHTVSSVATLQFQPVLTALRANDSTADQPSSPSRELRVEQWGPTHRQVHVLGGTESVLRVAENVNAGWTATMGDRSLEPVTLDGWQQGYRIPAGAEGTIVLRYAPDGPYRTGLLVGLVLAGVLVLAAIAGLVRHRPPGEMATMHAAGAGLLPRPVRLAAGVLVLVCGGWLAGAAYAAATWSRLRRCAAALGAWLIVASGVSAALSPVLAFGRPGLAANATAAVGAGLLLGSAVSSGPLLGAAPMLGRARVARVVGRLRNEWVLAVGLVLIAAQCLVRFWVASGSYWWQDDFLHLDLARRLGPTYEYLVRDYSGHVEPGQYLVIWLLSTVSGTSFHPAAIVLTIMQTLASLLFWLLLRQLFGRSTWLLVPLAAYLFSPLGLAAASWFAAGMQAMPLQVFLFTSLLGLVRLRSTGGRPWAVLTLVGHALGLAFWEKGAVILPTLLAVDLLVIGAGLPVRDRLAHLLRRWWLWGCHVLLLGGYVVFYLAVTERGSIGEQLDQGLTTTLPVMLLKMLVPGLFGGPWNARGADNTVFTDTSLPLQVVFLVAAIVLVAASFRRSGATALNGWLLVCSYVVGTVALVLFGRGSYLSLVSRDPRYFTDAVPIILIGVCAAFTSGDNLPSKGSRRATRPPSRRATPIVACTTALAIGLSGLITTHALLPGVQQRTSQEFVSKLVHDLGSEPASTVVAGALPTDVSISVGGESLLHAVGRELELGRPGQALRVLDLHGDLRPAKLIGTDTSVTGPRPDCGWRLLDTPLRLASLPDSGEGERVLRLRYLTGGEGILLLRFDGQRQAVPISPGAGEAFFVVGGGAGVLDAWLSDDSHGACVSGIARGVAWPADD